MVAHSPKERERIGSDLKLTLCLVLTKISLNLSNSTHYRAVFGSILCIYQPDVDA